MMFNFDYEPKTVFFPNGYCFQFGNNPFVRYKGKGGSIPKQQITQQRVEQDVGTQARLSQQAVYRRYAKVRRATIMNEGWKPENRQKLGPG